jgi:hypothetical protein
MNASRTVAQPCRSTQGAAFSSTQAQWRNSAASTSICRSRRMLVVRAAGEALEPDVYCCLVSSRFSSGPKLLSRSFACMVVAQ